MLLSLSHRELSMIHFNNSQTYCLFYTKAKLQLLTSYGVLFFSKLVVFLTVSLYKCNNLGTEKAAVGAAKADL